MGLVIDATQRTPLSTSTVAPSQLRATALPGGLDEPLGTVDGTLERRWCEEGAHPVLRDDLDRFGPQLGREVDQVVDRDPLRLIRLVSG